MTLFQILACSMLALILIGEAVLIVKRRRWDGFTAARLVVWLATAGAIASPETIQHMAGWLGIGRGADVVLYLFVLAFLFVSFYQYAGLVRLQRQVTEVVRRLAILEARRGG